MCLRLFGLAERRFERNTLNLLEAGGRIGPDSGDFRPTKRKREPVLANIDIRLRVAEALAVLGVRSPKSGSRLKVSPEYPGYSPDSVF